MRLFKKMIAIAMMAVICFTVATPVNVNALAGNSCSHAYARKTQKRQYLTEKKHYIMIEKDVNNQEPDETIIVECNRIFYDVWDVYLCLECNEVLFEIYYEEQYHHSTLCPYYGYYRPE